MFHILHCANLHYMLQLLKFYLLGQLKHLHVYRETLCKLVYTFNLNTAQKCVRASISIASSKFECFVFDDDDDDDCVVKRKHFLLTIRLFFFRNLTLTIPYIRTHNFTI